MMTFGGLLAMLIITGLGLLFFYPFATLFEKLLLSKVVARWQFIRAFGTEYDGDAAVLRRLATLRKRVARAEEQGWTQQLLVRMEEGVVDGRQVFYPAEELSNEESWAPTWTYRRARRRLARAEAAFYMYCYDQPLSHR